MDKDMDYYTKMIARLDTRMEKLRWMRRNITLDMTHLIVSEDNKTINNVYNSKQ